MAITSLFKACKTVGRNKVSSTEEIGGYNITIEYFNQETLDNGIYSLGNSSQENIVLLVDDIITIPSGKTLTTTYPKKSLVIFCNKLVNNGTISMTAKAPNVLPHDYYIWGKSDGMLLRTNSSSGDIEEYKTSITIPAYANNQVGGYNNSNALKGLAGANGANRNCGSGGTGCASNWNFASGSGYAFGGGAGSSGNAQDSSSAWDKLSIETKQSYKVDSTYPMHGQNYVDAVYSDIHNQIGGVGNPSGNGSKTQNTGCGGRIIIFCKEFVNNGTIATNGTTGVNNDYYVGGSSGAGAIDIFYTALTTKGTTTANGGGEVISSLNSQRHGGAGGNGSITFTSWALTQIYKQEEKYMSRENMIYFLQELVNRLAGE